MWAAEEDCLVAFIAYGLTIGKISMVSQCGNWWGMHVVAQFLFTPVTQSKIQKDAFYAVY
jgi:hypothetical protein